MTSTKLHWFTYCLFWHKNTNIIIFKLYSPNRRQIIAHTYTLLPLSNNREVAAYLEYFMYSMTINIEYWEYPMKVLSN